jgi:hypothetical protein
MFSYSNTSNAYILFLFLFIFLQHSRASKDIGPVECLQGERKNDSGKTTAGGCSRGPSPSW